MDSCTNCKSNPCISGSRLCANDLCADETAAAAGYRGEYMSASRAVGAEVATSVSPAGRDGRCVVCHVMPAQERVLMEGDASSRFRYAGVCTELCRTEYDKNPRAIGSIFEAVRHKGFQTRAVAELIIATKRAAAVADRQGQVDYVPFLQQAGYYPLLLNYVTAGGRRRFNDQDFTEFSNSVIAGSRTELTRAFVSLEVPETVAYDTTLLASRVASMYKKTWADRGEFFGLRSADARQYGARIFRDIMRLVNDESGARAVMAAVFNANELRAARSAATTPIGSHLDSLALSAVASPHDLQNLEYFQLESDSIDASLGGLARKIKGAAATGAKKVTAKAAVGAKKLTGKTAGVVATRASSVSKAASQVAFGEYDIRQVTNELDGLVAQYVWLKTKQTPAPPDALATTADFAAWLAFWGGFNTIIATQENVKALGVFAVEMDTLQKIVASKTRTISVQSTSDIAPTPSDMPTPGVNYVRLARNVYGMLLASTSEPRKAALGADITQMLQTLSKKYLPSYATEFVARFFFELAEKLAIEAELRP